MKREIYLAQSEGSNKVEKVSIPMGSSIDSVVKAYGERGYVRVKKSDYSRRVKEMRKESATRAERVKEEIHAKVEKKHLELQAKYDKEREESEKASLLEFKVAAVKKRNTLIEHGIALNTANVLCDLPPDFPLLSLEGGKPSPRELELLDSL